MEKANNPGVIDNEVKANGEAGNILLVSRDLQAAVRKMSPLESGRNIPSNMTDLSPWNLDGLQAFGVVFLEWFFLDAHRLGNKIYFKT